MNLEEPRRSSRPFPKSPPHACVNSWLTFKCATEKERRAGKVRCVECEGIILDPHLQEVTKESQALLPSEYYVAQVPLIRNGTLSFTEVFGNSHLIYH